jgi:Rho-binding antiterminator
MMSCSDYDYIEIACMHRYPIRMHLINGEQLEAIAIDTKRNQQKQECIQVEFNGEHKLVVLDTLQSMEVLVENPHFKEVTFNTSG